jgi:CheY-like chemotaxis protein
MTRETILIVEDDRVHATYLQQILTELAYSVKGPVASGEEAILVVAMWRPDLILMGIELAGEMDGITVAGEIMNVLDVPIIYLADYSQQNQLEEVKANMPHGYLVKPVPEWKLTGTIEMALHRHAFERGLSRKAKQEPPIS